MPFAWDENKATSNRQSIVSPLTMIPFALSVPEQSSVVNEVLRFLIRETQAKSQG
jgi:hypothetical protein